MTWVIYLTVKEGENAWWDQNVCFQKKRKLKLKVKPEYILEIYFKDMI